MTETTVELPNLSPVDTDPYRPAFPDLGPGRFLRRIAGIREEILDWAPEERPRYTRLGLILINTGAMAATSLLVALDRVVEVPWVTVLPVAVFWGLLVVALDSWMIASAHGALGRGRFLLFIPRLLIAILIGTVIAEPLLLWVFHPAVHAEVRKERQDDVTRFESRWRQCNPVNGSTIGQPECDGYHLDITPPDDVRTQLTTTTQERDKLKERVERLNAALADKEQLAQDECAGVARPGTSGRAGKGFRCDKAWEVADRFRKGNRIDEQEQELAILNGKVRSLTADLGSASASYGTDIDSGIAAKVEAREARYGEISLLEEDRALGRLSHDSFMVFAAQWLVRLLLVAIDCLPVLAKMLGGTTTYDHLVSRRLDAGKRIHDRWLGVREWRKRATTDVEIREIDHYRDLRMQQIDEEGRAARAQHDEDLDAEIDRLAARYAREK